MLTIFINVNNIYLQRQYLLTLTIRDKNKNNQNIY